MKNKLMNIALLLLLLSNHTYGSSFHFLKTEIFTGFAKGDYSINKISSQSLLGIETNALINVRNNWGIQFDICGTRYVNNLNYLSTALRAFYKDSNFSIATNYQFSKLDVFENHLFAINCALYEHPSYTVNSTIGFESRNFEGNLYIGELFLNIMPQSNFLISCGVSYAETKIKQTRADIVVNGEYLLGLINTCPVSIYLQYGGNNLSKLSLGVKMYFNNGNLLELQNAGVYSTRFK